MGAAICGQRAASEKSKVPASMTSPPSTEPWPASALVAECTTMSAPNSMGRYAAGVARVLSTTTGMPAAWAVSAMARRSTRVISGLETDSSRKPRVLGVMAAAQFAGSSGSTKVTVIPKSAKVSVSRSTVPP